MKQQKGRDSQERREHAGKEKAPSLASLPGKPCEVDHRGSRKEKDGVAEPGHDVDERDQEEGAAPLDPAKRGPEEKQRGREREGVVLGIAREELEAASERDHGEDRELRPRVIVQLSRDERRENEREQAEQKPGHGEGSKRRAAQYTMDRVDDRDR